MKKTMKLRPFILIAALTGSPAMAGEWYVDVVGPDIFGKTKVIAVAPGPSLSIIVQCDSESVPKLALVEPAKTPVDGPKPGLEILLKAGAGDIIKSPAILDRWNEQMNASIAHDPFKTERMIEAIGEASGEILVGISVLGEEISASFSSTGSTRAMAMVKKHCLTIDE